MTTHEDKFDLTQRERDVMEVLWDSKTPLIASEISQTGLTKSTVLATLKRLLKKELIAVADIVYSGTVLSRSFSPTINREDFEQQRFINNFDKIKMPPSNFIASLLGSRENPEQALKEIAELEEMLKVKKQEFLEQEKKKRK